MNSNKSVVILYNQLLENPSKDAADVLHQVDAVYKALTELGYKVFKCTFNGDFGELKDNIKKINPVFVFNLVEEISGKSKYSYLIPSFFESMDIKYTGCSGEAIMLTTNKITTKLLMKAYSISTPCWITFEQDFGFDFHDTYIIKAVYEDGSVGLNQNSIVKYEDILQLRNKIKSVAEKSKEEAFAEKFIDGREINISILGKSGNPTILTPCEIKFLGFEDKNKAKIFDYRAKWEEESFEYQNIKSSNDFEEKDKELIKKLKKAALACWQEFKLNGYARIDFRIDSGGNPYVLEINANPCITPGDSSFIRSTENSGISYNQVIDYIISAV